MAVESIRIIDTHTGGEPTRIIVDAALPLGGGGLDTQARVFQTRLDRYRRALICEPRGNDVLVGALLVPATKPTSAAGVIFFNNVGILGMCGHGTIGVAVALQFLNRIELGSHRLETCVGDVQFELGQRNQVTLENVKSFRWRRQVPITLSTGQTVHGDIAWGGNWFFICSDHGVSVELENSEKLSRFSRSIRRALDEGSVRAAAGAVIDHIELIGPATDPKVADAKNFVLCPGAAYDRSPCGTGTSAKVACLAADGALQPGQIHRQESIAGSVFEASFEWAGATGESDAEVIPTIRGTAFVNGEGHAILDSNDPFCWGIQ